MTIELYGVARIRARVHRVEIPAGTLGQAIAGLAAVCPALSGTVVIAGSIHPAFRLSLNGDRFVSDPATLLTDDDVLLLISADAGG